MVATKNLSMCDSGRDYVHFSQGNRRADVNTIFFLSIHILISYHGLLRTIIICFFSEINGGKLMRRVMVGRV